MRQFLNWLSSWWYVRGFCLRTTRKVQCLDQKINRISAEYAAAKFDLERHITKLTRMKREVDEEIDRALLSLKTAGLLHERQTEALEATREKLKTQEEIIVPALVAGHKVVMSRMEADMAVNARRVVDNTIMRDQQ